MFTQPTSVFHLLSANWPWLIVAAFAFGPVFYTVWRWRHPHELEGGIIIPEAVLPDAMEISVSKSAAHWKEHFDLRGWLYTASITVDGGRQLKLSVTEYEDLDQIGWQYEIGVAGERIAWDFARSREEAMAAAEIAADQHKR